MITAEMNQSCLAPVSDFRAGLGWENDIEAAGRAQWCCEQLEDSRILYFEDLPYDFPAADREFLVSQRLGDSRFHKNISYRPKADVLRGFSGDAGTEQRILAIMRLYSKQVIQFLSRLLTPYAASWDLDYASFRPEAEEHRDLPLHKRNDLLHTDAFPNRPTRGGRILRCFTNVNPKDVRVWQITDAFQQLAGKFAREAGLAEFGWGNSPGLGERLAQVFGLQPKSQSPYDKFMLRFHDFLKENTAFQRDCPKTRLEFPPGSTWICFTDSVPHAVLKGQFAVEQTLIVPVSALVTPQKSPLRVLEAMAGHPLARVVA